MQPARFSRVVVYMRSLFLVLTLAGVSALAQTRERVRPVPGPRIAGGALTAEMAVKQAMEQLAATKKAYDRDVEVLNFLRGADDALADAMQPSNAIEKAYESVEKAKGSGPDFTVMQGVLKIERELESARRSPIGADFGRLRSVLRDEALGPAIRVAARNALRLQEESLAWLRVQELIAAHVRTLTEISGESLRAAQK
jgi:hypothetical protein